MRIPTRLSLAALAALAILPPAGGCDGDDPRDPGTWAGRYDGTFEGTYVAQTRLSAERGNLVTSTFAGTAWVEIASDGRHLQVHVVDCDLAWGLEDGRATLAPGQDAEGCRLDVAGDVGVVPITPRSGTARLDGGALALRLEAEGEPGAGSEEPSKLTFAFEGQPR